MDNPFGPLLDVDQIEGYHIGDDRRISLFLNVRGGPVALTFSPDQGSELFERLLEIMDEFCQRYGPLALPLEIMPTAMSIGLPEGGDSVIVKLEHQSLHFPLALSRTAALEMATQVQRRILETTSPGANGPQ